VQRLSARVVLYRGEVPRCARADLGEQDEGGQGRLGENVGRLSRYGAKQANDCPFSMRVRHASACSLHQFIFISAQSHLASKAVPAQPVGHLLMKDLVSRPASIYEMMRAASRPPGKEKGPVLL